MRDDSDVARLGTGRLDIRDCRMLDFAGRHGVEPVTETFSFDDINEAINHLRDGKARYRVVLEH